MFPLIWQNLFCRCEPTKALEITKLPDPGDITVSLQEEVKGRIQASMGIDEDRIKVGGIWFENGANYQRPNISEVTRS